MTTDAKVQIGLSSEFLEGTAVDTPAGTGLFREGVVLSDPQDADGRANVRALDVPLVDADKGIVTNTVIHGRTTAGHGAFVDVKVNPSGALSVDSSGSVVALDAATLSALESVNVQNTVTVQATDLDIRNLSSAQDSVTVTGTVNASVTGSVEISNDIGNPIPVNGTVAVTDGGGSLTVDGSVSVANFPATQAVSGTVALDAASLAALETINVGNFPATQQVSGTVTANAGTGTFNVTGSVSVNNTVAVSATDLDIRNLSSAQDNVRAFDSTDSEYLRVATSITAPGDTILITPAAGKRIRLQWVYAINDPTASSSPKITIKLGSDVQYVAWAISKRQQLTGAVDAPLVINLSQTGDVAVTIFYQEVD